MAQAPMIRKIREFLLGGPALNKLGGSRIPGGGPISVGRARQVRPQGWQWSAWYVWHKLGEIRFPTEHLARQVGRLEWDVYVDDVQLSEEDARGVMREVTAGLGPREASRLGGLNLQIAGEGWYIEETVGQFTFYSITQKGLEQKVQAAQAAGRIALRVYFPDPTDLDAAESAVQTALGPAEELLTHEALSGAQSRSRLAQAGLLLVATQIQFADDSDPFGADFERATEAAITDPSSAAAMVPIKVEVDQELIENGVKHLTFDRPYDNKVPEKIVAATKRIALALDVPAELLLGTGDANHWTAWLTALETYTSHLEPLATTLGELWAGVAEILLERAGRPGRRVEIKPNPSRILAKRSTVRDALDAAKIGAVGLKYVRTAIGADDEDAPTPEELEILLRIPAETGREPLVDEGTGEATPSGPDPVSAALVPNVDPVAGAMGIAALVARAKVGAKLRTAVMSNAELRARIDGIPNEDVAHALNGSGGDLIDLNTAVVDGLSAFRTWWTSHRPGAANPNVATGLFGCWVADTLTEPTDTLSIPEWLVDEVTSGRPRRHNAA